MQCREKTCINPCLLKGVCGENAQCRVVNRKAQCTCPPGHFGHPKVKCSKGWLSKFKK